MRATLTSSNLLVINFEHQRFQTFTSYQPQQVEQELQKVNREKQFTFEKRNKNYITSTTDSSP